MITYRTPKLSVRHRGQAMVEMALVVTVLLFLTMGLIQFALLANARITLTNLAREGARNAAVNVMTGTQTQGETTVKNYVVQVADATPLSSVAAGNVVITYPGTGRASGQPVQVAVSYDMRSKFILPVSFPGLSRFGTSTTATAIMIIE